MKRQSLAISILFASMSANAWFFDDDNMNSLQQEAERREYAEIVDAPELCRYLTREACALIVKTPAVNINTPGLQGEDKVILSELLQLSADSVASAGQAIPDARLSILRTSALTLGVQIGIAVESARYNRLWDQYSAIYDRAINFEPLMVGHGGGRNIIPPVITVMNESRQVGSGGRVFRFADTTFRIEEQPRFALSPPNWRNYLQLDVSKPATPVSGLLPQTAEESNYWRVEVMRGYLQGIETTRFRVQARYRTLMRDYLGMSMYHLLRTYNMVSEPKVEYSHNPVLATHSGSVMSIDDTVSVLSVEPLFNLSRTTWKVYPQLKRMESLQRSYIVNPMSEAM